MPDTPPPKPEEVRIAVICALPLEGSAVRALFNDEWHFNKMCPPPEDDDDEHPNNYSVGMVGHHRVVLVYMSEIGKNAAIAEALTLKRYFKKIKLVLVVGICAATPSNEVHFGDAIISMGLIPYDSGKQVGENYVMKEDIVKPARNLLSFISKLRDEDYADKLRKSARTHLQAKPLHEKYKKIQFPKLQKDWQKPNIHFGDVASGDTVIKSKATQMEIYNRCRYKPIAYEMEGAGAESIFKGKVVVIKSVVDHADEKKNKEYQPYAALTAAAYMRAFLDEWNPPPEPTETSKREVAKTAAKHVVDKVRGRSTGPPPNRDGPALDAVEERDTKNVQGLLSPAQTSGSQHPARSSQLANEHDERVPYRSREPTTQPPASTKRIVNEIPTVRVENNVNTSNKDIQGLGGSLAKEPHNTPHRENENSIKSGGIGLSTNALNETPSNGSKSNLQALNQQPINVDTSDTQRSDIKGTTEPPELSPTLSTASTHIGSTRGEVEEVAKPITFSFDKPEKPVVVCVTKVKSESEETQDLFSACKQRDINEVQRLLGTGEVDPCALNAQGQTMLHVAIGSGKVDDSPNKMQKISDVISALCKSGAKPNDKDKYGVAPIHHCVKTMNIEAAKRLIALGANVNILDSKNRTALNYMAADGYPDEEFTKMLIRQGARLGPPALPKMKRTANEQQWAVRGLLENVGKIAVN